MGKRQIEVVDAVMAEIYKKRHQWSGFKLPLGCGTQSEHSYSTVFVLCILIGMNDRYNKRL